MKWLVDIINEFPEDRSCMESLLPGGSLTYGELAFAILEKKKILSGRELSFGIYFLDCTSPIDFVTSFLALTSMGQFAVPINLSGLDSKRDRLRILNFKGHYHYSTLTSELKVLEAFSGPKAKTCDFSYGLLSSGSQGLTKVICYSESKSRALLDRYINLFSVSSESREWCYSAMSHSDSFMRVFATLACGGKIYFAPVMGVLSRLSDVDINTFFLSYPLLKLLRTLKGEFAFEKVESLEIGSHDYTVSDKSWIIKNFPEAEVIMHYGLTECSRATTISSYSPNFLEDSLVGLPTKETKISLSVERKIIISSSLCADACLTHEKLGYYQGHIETTDEGKIGPYGLYFLGRNDSFISRLGHHFYVTEVTRLIESLQLDLDFLVRKGVTDQDGDRLDLYLLKKDLHQFKKIVTILPSYMAIDVKVVMRLVRDHNHKIVGIDE